MALNDSRNQTQVDPRTSDTQTHIKAQVLEMKINVSGGSPTEVTISVPDCGGFLAAHGDNGPEKLRSFLSAIGRAANGWFENNQADYGVLSPYRR